MVQEVQRQGCAPSNSSATSIAALIPLKLSTTPVNKTFHQNPAYRRLILFLEPTREWASWYGSNAALHRKSNCFPVVFGMFFTLLRKCWNHQFSKWPHEYQMARSPGENTTLRCGWSGEKEVGNFRANLTFKCDLVTQTLDSAWKNLVNKPSFFLFPVWIFMQSQCNNPDLFFLTLYLSPLFNWASFWASYKMTFDSNTPGL